jgi:hypothetical protein
MSEDIDLFQNLKEEMQTSVINITRSRALTKEILLLAEKTIT